MCYVESDGLSGLGSNVKFRRFLRSLRWCMLCKCKYSYIYMLEAQTRYISCCMLIIVRLFCPMIRLAR